MIPIIPPSFAARGCFLKPRFAFALKSVALVACVLASVSCEEQRPPLVDTKPLGDGLRVIAYAVVGAAVLGVLGKLVK